MKNIRNITRVVMTMIAFLSVSLSTQAAEVVYRIVIQQVDTRLQSGSMWHGAERLVGVL